MKAYPAPRPAPADLEALLKRTRDFDAGIVLTYLGQVGFLLQHRGVSITIDPYLTDACDHSPGFPDGFWRRNYPPPIAPGRLENLDLVLCTHDHLDHLDPDSLLAIAAASPACVFAGPNVSARVMLEAGLPRDRVSVLNSGTPFFFQGVRIDPIAAAHETYEQDAEGHHRYLGYILQWDGITIYHAGDTVADERLSTTIASHRIDIGLLPINGRDEARRRLDIIGNMDAAEAASFAVAHHFDLVVPTHHDLYARNGASAADFAARLEALDPFQKFKVFRPGEQMVYLPRRHAP